MNFNIPLKKHKNAFIFLIMVLVSIAALTVWFSQSEVSKTADILDFYAIDVGQGDSFLFVLPDGKTILIDAGDEEGGKQVVSLLKSKGIKDIDLLVASHPHFDHIGGMDILLRNFNIGKIWDSGFNHGSAIQRKFYKTIKQKDIPFRRPKRGYSEQFGDVYIEVIAPKLLLKNTRSDANNNCLVLKITYKQISFLMTADMERAQRATIEPLPRATVLKAAHHGSYNGTDIKSLRSVQPSLIILSYAKNNPYGYPHREVVRDIKKEGIPRFDTADGTLKIETNGFNIRTSREQVRKDK